MRKRESSRLLRRGALILVIGSLTACQGEAPAPTDDMSGMQGSPESVTSGLESMSLRNLEGLPESVTLVDGMWQGEPFVDGGNVRASVNLVRPMTAQGDLGSDGVNEVVAVVVADTGGSGYFYYLALLRQSNDGLDHFATQFLGDRVEISSLEIVDGGIEITQLEQGDGDAMCCPTQRVDRRYELDGGKVVVASERYAGPLERILGYLTWGHENRSLRTCDEDREGWVTDAVESLALGDLVAEFVIEPYEPVFVDVEGRWLGQQSPGFGEEFADAIEITDVYRVEREGWGCRLEVDSFVFRGSGNEPGWHVELRDDGATLVTGNGSRTLTWDRSDAIEDKQWAFESDAGRIDINYRSSHCRDSMSGSFFSHVVEVQLDDEEFAGCAVPGTQQ